MVSEPRTIIRLMIGNLTIVSWTIVCYPKKNLILVQVIRYEFGGYPPPLLYGFFFSKKGVTDLGGPPPPLYGQNPQSSI